MFFFLISKVLYCSMHYLFKSIYPANNYYYTCFIWHYFSKLFHWPIAAPSLKTKSDYRSIWGGLKHEFVPSVLDTRAGWAWLSVAGRRWPSETASRTGFLPPIDSRCGTATDKHNLVRLGENGYCKVWKTRRRVIRTLAQWRKARTRGTSLGSSLARAARWLVVRQATSFPALTLHINPLQRQQTTPISYDRLLLMSSNIYSLCAVTIYCWH